MIAVLLLSLVDPSSPFLHVPRKTTFRLAEKPQGRNPDADTIANTGDLYMAQLKLDSKIRKKAFLAGDNEKAQEQFKDPRVHALLETEAANNPNLKRMRAATPDGERKAEEMTHLMMNSMRAPKADSDVKQTSYRDKLAQAKSKRTGHVREAVAQPVAKPVAQEIMAPAVQEVEDAAALEVKQVNYREKLEQAKRKKEAEKEGPVTVAEVRESEEAKEAPAVGEDEARQKVRLLQGLLLKHRGGVGFGAGRLKGPEAARLQGTMEEMADILRSELDAPEPALANVEPPVALEPPPPQIPQTPPAPLLSNVQPRVVAPVPVPPPVPAPAPVAAAPPAPVAIQTTPASQESIVEAMNFAASAMETYKLAPLQARSSLTGMVKSALLTVISSIEPPALVEEPPSPLAAPVCPVQIQPPPVSPATTPAPNPPQSFSEIASNMDFQPPAAVPDSSAASLEALKRVEEKLSAVAGSGPSGLNLESLDEDQARDLVGELDSVRQILLDELDF